MEFLTGTARDARQAPHDVRVRQHRALAAGLVDQTHVLRMFKDAVGVSPACYRALEATGTR
jgi:AraC-like DNA-binding protein